MFPPFPGFSALRRVLFPLLTALLFLTGGAAAEPVPVGRAQEVKDVFLPGPELRVRKSDGAKDPLVLRITDVFQHGTAGFRYNFSWMPLEAGTFNLADFLERADGSPAGALPEVAVASAAMLPPGPPRFLTPTPPVQPEPMGGYKELIPWGIALWALLGAVMLAWWIVRGKRLAALTTVKSAVNLTLAERLQPLLERALVRPLETQEKAELERLLLSHGRERLGLTAAAEPAVWQALRTHPSTAPWLRTLESWLHRPASAAPTQQELQDLLTAIKTSGS